MHYVHTTRMKTCHFEDENAPV